VNGWDADDKLAWREFRGIWVDLLYAADDVRTRREWEREVVASGAIEDWRGLARLPGQYLR
jgi:hypothetical protein